MKNARLIIGGLMLAASTALLAQTLPAPGAPDGTKGGPYGRPPACAQAADPAKCEAQRKEMREKGRQRMNEAREACKGREKPEQGKCVAQHMCAKAQDPAKCEAHAKEHMERRRETREKGGEKGNPPAAPKT